MGPGDGKTAPNGPSGSGGSMAGNNFVTNPAGSGGGGPKPRSFVVPAPELAQQRPGRAEPNPEMTTPGPRTAAEVVTPKDRVGNPIGFGPMGSGNRMPFKLGG